VKTVNVFDHWHETFHALFEIVRNLTISPAERQEYGKCFRQIGYATILLHLMHIAFLADDPYCSSFPESFSRFVAFHAISL